MAKVFIMQGNYAGKSIRLMGRYNFVDGVHLEEDDDSAKMKSTILTQFYPCKVMDHEEYVKQQAKSKPVPAAPAASTAQAVDPSSVVPKGSVSTAPTK
jgi:hypothetical protein